MQSQHSIDNRPATTPPTLGTVLTLSFWRYVVIPLYTIPFIHLLRKIPSTKAYLQDPVFVSRFVQPFIL